MIPISKMAGAVQPSATLAAGAKALRPYAHRRSPKKYTQPQLFACLALKTFFKTDYRGVAQHLSELSNLRRVLGRRQRVKPGLFVG